MQLRRNNKRGGTLALSTILILVLVMIGLAFFAYTKFIGGAQEVKDAVNAGALNVAVQAVNAPDVTVTLPAGDFFTDVTPNGNGQVNLSNINRVWSKALFVAINADGAKQDGGHDGSGGNSAQAAQQAAEAISDELAQKLDTASNFYNFFNDYSMANSVRMLGLGATVQAVPGSGWDTAYMERTFESNVQAENNLPVGYSPPSNLFTSSKRTPQPPDAAGLQFVTGYQPIQVMGQTFWQVAFPFEQKPHLIDLNDFNNNKTKPLNIGGSIWNTPVPNAFTVTGKTVNGTPISALTAVETNPQQTFPMQIPHAYVRIVLKTNTVQFYDNFIPADSYSYGFEPGQSQSNIPIVVGCGSLSGTAYVGNEYATGTLYQAVTGFIQMPGNTMTYLLQRVQEMVPGYSMAQLTAKMLSTFIDTGDSDQTFFIYPTSDNKDIQISSQSSAMLPSGCDGSATPEGTQQTLDTEPPMPEPNYATQDLTCAAETPAVCTESGTRTWIPGTGWNGGCLGELTIKRTTSVYLIGFCPCG